MNPGASAVTVYSSAVSVTAAPEQWDELEPKVVETIEHLFGYYGDDAGWSPDSLRAIGAQVPQWVPDDYDYFRVAPGGTVLWPESEGYPFERAFALRFDADRSAVAGVVRTFGDSLLIRVYGDRGETWFSWMQRQPS